jgi:hypothetical protein
VTAPQLTASAMAQSSKILISGFQIIKKGEKSASYAHGEDGSFERFKNVHIMPNSKCNVNHTSVFCQLYNNAEISE